MTVGSFLIVWSIRLSMMSLVATLLAWSLWRSRSQANPAIRILWTSSFLLFVLHVCAAFHFEHDWSHQRAYLATAKETRELMGLEFGSGVYFNYLFLLGWALHVWFTWRPAADTNAYIRTLLQVILVYMLFIAFNGVVVFKAGWLRWSGIIATLAIALAATRHMDTSQWGLKRFLHQGGLSPDPAETTTRENKKS